MSEAVTVLSSFRGIVCDGQTHRHTHTQYRLGVLLLKLFQSTTLKTEMTLVPYLIVNTCSPQT